MASTTQDPMVIHPRNASFTCFDLVYWYSLLVYTRTFLVGFTYGFNIFNSNNNNNSLSFYAMYKACQEKKIPFAKTMIVQNMPIATYVICLYFWVTSPYSTILSDHHFMLFSITTGIVFGRMATKVILAHLTRSSFPKFTVLLVPLIIGALLTNVPRLIPT